MVSGASSRPTCPAAGWPVVGFGHAPVDHLLPVQRGSLGLKDYWERSAEGFAEPSWRALIALPFLEGKIPSNFSGSRIGPRAQTCSGFSSPYSPLRADSLAREPAAQQECAEPHQAEQAATAAGAQGPAPRCCPLLQPALLPSSP